MPMKQLRGNGTDRPRKPDKAEEEVEGGRLMMGVGVHIP